MFDFGKLGKKALIAPFVLVIALCCVLCLAVAPLLRADPHDISLAIVNLDDGTTTPVGAVNAGEVLASQLTGEESQAAQESTETLAKLTAMKAAAASGAAAATNGAAATESSEAPNLVAVTSSDSAASTNGAVEAAEGAADSGLAAGTQAAFIVALSALIAAFALLIDVAAGGLDLPAGQLFCWLWLGCACVMLALVGLTDACLPVGALFAITVFAVGMGTAMLPAELMPHSGPTGCSRGRRKRTWSRRAHHRLLWPKPRHGRRRPTYGLRRHRHRRPAAGRRPCDREKRESERHRARRSIASISIPSSCAALPGCGFAGSFCAGFGRGRWSKRDRAWDSAPFCRRPAHRWARTSS